MPVIRYFTVTQTREVKVATNSVITAAELATRVFNEEAITSEPGARVLSQVRETSLTVSEDDR